MNLLYLYVIGFLCILICCFSIFDIHPISMIISEYRSLENKVFKNLQLPKKRFVPLKNVKKVKKRTGFYIPTQYVKYAKYVIYALAALFIILFFMDKSLMMIPIIYAIFILPDFIILKRKKDNQIKLAEELHISLSCVTNSFMRGSLADAIRENINIIDSPVKEAFEYYLDLTEEVSSSDYDNLERLKSRINHPLWEEWINVVQDSAYDSNQKKLLFDVVNRLAVEREIHMLGEQAAYQTKNEFNISVAMTAVGCVGLCFMNNGIRDTMFNTWYGNLVLSITAVMLLYAVHGVNKVISQNLMYYGKKED